MRQSPHPWDKGLATFGNPCTWVARALELATLATERLGPAKGARVGFPKGRFTLRQIAGDQLKR